MKKTPIQGLGTALKTLTLIPWSSKNADNFSLSLPWFPVVGLLLGFVLYGISLLGSMAPIPAWPAGMAVLIVALEVFLTRGLHLDGLADWADSIGGFREREKRLAIMKDVSLGAFGSLALILVLLVKWVALVRIISSGSIIWLPVIFAISRCMLVELITTLPYARKGQGMGKAFVEGASLGHRLTSHIICIVICLSLGPLGLALFISAGLMTGMFKMRCRHQFGGITGDLLGTANEMVEVILLIMCAWAGGLLLSYTGWGWVF